LLQNSFWCVEQKFLEPLIRFAGADCAACADLSVVQIVICKSTGAAFASSGHNALNAMPKTASQATKRRFMRRSL